jgi:HKD family nuclease
MKLEFIGHGLHGKTKDTVGDYLCSSFKDSTYNIFFGFSAFTKLSGLKIFLNDILKAKSRYKELKLYLGISVKGTSKEALELLLENQIETWAFCTSSSLIFHPKLFFFEGDLKTRIIIGSSNLTKPGLFNNIEASVAIEFLNTDKSGQRLKNQIIDYFKTILNGTDENIQILTSDLIKDFIKSGFVFDELNTRDDSEYFDKNKLLFKKRKKIKTTEELGSIKSKDFYDGSKTQEYKITEKYLEAWNEMFEKILNFKKENNTVTVPRDYIDPSLYTWYRKQKIFFSNDSIPKEHKDLLTQQNFYFGDGHDIRNNRIWEGNYKELLAYFEKNGHSAVHRHKNPKHPLHKLSNWVAIQRFQFNSKNPKLTDYRIERLNDLNFKWSMPNAAIGGQPDDDNWLENYFKLEQYKNSHDGNCNPSQKDPNPKIARLGKWVNDQMTLRNKGRHRKNRKSAFLLKERETLLTELGVDWLYELNKHKKSFEKQLSAFLKFRKLYPFLNPPTGEFKKEREWRAQMKSRFKELPDWKQKRLKEMKII